ncbi:VOC family protein [uncultured Pseudacidovorax sp.]|uniref:VOC family protein n=1 Tax=uncultured Pseudacidovorax sp. TaxID=679313 RepID=UPI0025D2DCC7|nr:VOC family protein [uncultured Pseudacidovorax sp.]
MRIEQLDHFTLRTTRLDASRQFFEQVAGLRVGPRPPFPFPGVWLYLNDRPVVHLAAPAQDAALDDYLGMRHQGAGGAVDHIAFRGSDLPAFETRLRALALPYRGRTVPVLAEHQVFVADPNAVTIEFIFASTETASWT